MLAEIATAFFALAMALFGIVGAATWADLLSPNRRSARTPTWGASHS